MSSESTRRPRRTPTDEEIPSLLEALEAAGGNIAAFARERGLSPWKLYEARRVAAGATARRERRGRARPRRPQRKHQPESSDAPEFIALQVVEEEGGSPPAPLELVLGSGQRLLIPSGFDATTLRRLLGVLASC
jgi:hypothetical protein